MSANRTLYAFYDLAVSPVSYDFTAFAVSAERARRTRGLDAIHFVVVPFGETGGHHDNDQFDAEHGRWRLTNIVQPICWLLPSCKGSSVCETREAAQELLSIAKGNVFPEGYSIDRPIERHHTGWTVLAGHLGEDIQYFQVSEQARAYARQWIDSHAMGRKCVALTLREAPFGTSRNSDLTVWTEFARRLEDDDYFPVFLRDIDTALDPPPAELAKFAVFPEGVFNLELRMGLYEECHLAAFVANGPAQACFYDKNVRFLYVVTGDWLTNVPSPFNRMGIDFGETPPFLNQFQRWMWKEQNADDLMAALVSLDRFVKDRRADGTFDACLTPDPRNRRPMAEMAERQQNWLRRIYHSSPQEIELAEAYNLHSGMDESEEEKALRLANAALAANDPHKAADLLQAAGDKYGFTPELLVRLGLVHEALDQPVEAIEFYERAYSTTDRPPQISFRLGVVYQRVNRYGDAVDCLRFLTERGARNPKIFNELGRAFEGLGDCDAARANFDLAAAYAVPTVD